MKQRNQYLKQLNEKKQTDLLYLDILSEQLAAFGSKVLKARAQFVKRLEFWANSLHQQITHQKEQLEIEYLTAVDSLETHTQEQIQEQFLALLNQNKKKDLFGEQRQLVLIVTIFPFLLIRKMCRLMDRKDSKEQLH